MANCCSSIFCEEVSSIRLLNNLVNTAATFGFDADDCSNFEYHEPSVGVGGCCGTPTANDVCPSFNLVGSGNSAIYTVGSFNNGWNDMDGVFIDNSSSSYSSSQLDLRYPYGEGGGACCSGITNTLISDAKFMFIKFKEFISPSVVNSNFCYSGDTSIDWLYGVERNKVYYDCNERKYKNEESEKYNSKLDHTPLNIRNIISAVCVSSDEEVKNPIPLDEFTGYTSQDGIIEISRDDIFNVKFNKSSLNLIDYSSTCGSDIDVSVEGSDAYITYYPMFRDCQVGESTTHLHKNGANFYLKWDFSAFTESESLSAECADTACTVCISNKSTSGYVTVGIISGTSDAIDISGWDLEPEDDDVLNDLTVGMSQIGDKNAYEIQLRNDEEYKGPLRKFKIVIDVKECDGIPITLCSGLICQNGVKTSSQGGCNEIPLTEINCGDDLDNFLESL